MRKIFASVLVAVVALFLIGCLSAEKKEYTWEFKDANSGSAKIVWRGIFSSGNTENDGSAEDFVSLINDYLNGTTLESEFPEIKNVKKRLFIEGGKICGEMTFDFENLSGIGFYFYKPDGPLMFLLKSTDETFVESNGEWGGENFTALFWKKGTKKCTLGTTLGDASAEGSISFADFYKAWEKDGTLPDVSEGDSEENNPEDGE